MQRKKLTNLSFHKLFPYFSISICFCGITPHGQSVQFFKTLIILAWDLRMEIILSFPSSTYPKSYWAITCPLQTSLFPNSWWSLGRVQQREVFLRYGHETGQHRFYNHVHRGCKRRAFLKSGFQNWPFVTI